NGVFEIVVPSYCRKPFTVVCDVETQGGGWTVFLRRMDGSVDFYRDWADYKEGFGNLEGEFWLGLDKLHALTTDQDQELLVLLEDFEGKAMYEYYDAFKIGDERELYKMHTLGEGKGTAGDSLKYHFGMNFTTRERDNDLSADNCAELYTSAWWYKHCHESNLMGNYKDNTYGRGVNWKSFRGYEYALKQAVMMLRPKKEINGESITHK
ncbi:hypothetical protein KR222_008209, partial [Zaprionus bogoriensis]